MVTFELFNDDFIQSNLK